MAQYFNFARLITKYSRPLTAEIPTEGSYDNKGDYVAGTPTKVTFTGAVIAHRQNKIFRSEGTLTEQDRALYMLTPLENALIGAIVTCDGKKYRISSELENATFTGVYAYTLKFQSAFNKEDEKGAGE